VLGPVHVRTVQYFPIGDIRSNSAHSRAFGPVGAFDRGQGDEVAFRFDLTSASERDPVRGAVTRWGIATCNRGEACRTPAPSGEYANTEHDCERKDSGSTRLRLGEQR